MDFLTWREQQAKEYKPIEIRIPKAEWEKMKESEDQKVSNDKKVIAAGRYPEDVPNPNKKASNSNVELVQVELQDFEEAEKFIAYLPTVIGLMRNNISPTYKFEHSLMCGSCETVYQCCEGHYDGETTICDNRTGRFGSGHWAASSFTCCQS